MSSTASRKKPRKPRATISKKQPIGSKRSGSGSAKKVTSEPKIAPSVFEQIGMSSEESRVALLKVELLAKILEIYRSSKFTKSDIGRIWGKPHSRVSEVLSGKLHLVSVETLISLLEKMGATVKISVEMKEAG